MTFRSRVLLALVPLAILPLGLFAWGTRALLEERLTAQYEAAVESASASVSARIDETAVRVADRVRAFAQSLADDYRFRLGALQLDPDERAYVHDLAANAMSRAGLDALEVQNEDGQIISSGHFPNAFDQPSPDLATVAGAAELRPVVARVRTANEEFVAIMRATAVSLGTRTFRVVGGVRVDERFLAGLATDPGVSVALEIPGVGPQNASAADGRSAEGPLTRVIALPFADTDAAMASAGNASLGTGTAHLVVTASDEPLRQLRAQIDRWLLGALGAAALLAIVLASWVSARVSRPLAELQRKTSGIDLNRLDVDFDTDRSDEIGALSNMMGAMQRRLQSSASRLRDAERRAVIGEVARQVNHDVRNGLTPIRNVVEHLGEVARDQPEQLASVFNERRDTLDASIDYLHSLAANYARISPRLQKKRCDVNEIALEVARGMPDDGVRMRTDLQAGGAIVVADPIALRRIIENLVTNAVESIENGVGEVAIVTRVAEDGGRVRIHVADSGRGMSEEEKARVFDHFYTTKSRGTGLGLSIVRRLASDLGGSIRVHSEPSKGTRFTVDLPAASEPLLSERDATVDGEGT